MEVANAAIATGPQCKRCGTCCRNGGPTLHAEDLPLIGCAAIPLARLITIRGNEPAYNQHSATLELDRREFVKVAGAAGSWICLFWHEAEKSCRMYKNRPLECRLLFCEDTSGIENVMGRDLLSREDILAADEEVVQTIRQHDSKCSYTLINELVADFLNDPSANEKLVRISEMVQTDLQIRGSCFAARPDLLPIEMLLFGRPVFIALSPYGFRPVETRGALSMKYDGRYADSLIAATN